MRIHAHARRSTAALAGAAAGLLVLAACGSSGSSASSSTPASSAATTVTVANDGGMQVLADSAGQTLYVSSQENGKVLCTSSACHAVWVPLTVSGSQRPTAPSGLGQDLSTMKLSDGTTQVAFNGHPLYTFALDHGPGQLNGNGQSDSFNGTSFTWHAATPTGMAPSPSPSSTQSSSGSRYGY